MAAAAVYTATAAGRRRRAPDPPFIGQDGTAADAGLADYCRRHGLVLVRVSSTPGRPAADPDAGWTDVRLVDPGRAAGLLALTALLLIGALIAHRRAADNGKEMAPALLALATTIAYLPGHRPHQLGVTRPAAASGSFPGTRHVRSDQ